MAQKDNNFELLNQQVTKYLSDINGLKDKNESLNNEIKKAERKNKDLNNEMKLLKDNIKLLKKENKALKEGQE